MVDQDEDRLVECGVPPAFRALCSHCGNFRAHGKQCLFCMLEGRYTEKEIYSETMKIVVEWAKRLPRGHEKREYLEQHLMVAMPNKEKGRGRFDTRTPVQKKKAQERLLRAKQIRLCTMLLAEVGRLFERDLNGKLTLYADRMEEVEAWHDMVSRIVPELIKAYRVRLKNWDETTLETYPVKRTEKKPKIRRTFNGRKGKPAF